MKFNFHYFISNISDEMFSCCGECALNIVICLCLHILNVVDHSMEYFVSESWQLLNFESPRFSLSLVKQQTLVCFFYFTLFNFISADRLWCSLRCYGSYEASSHVITTDTQEFWLRLCERFPFISHCSASHFFSHISHLPACGKM